VAVSLLNSALEVYGNALRQPILMSFIPQQSTFSAAWRHFYRLGQVMGYLWDRLWVKSQGCWDQSKYNGVIGGSHAAPQVYDDTMKGYANGWVSCCGVSQDVTWWLGANYPYKQRVVRCQRRQRFALTYLGL